MKTIRLPSADQSGARSPAGSNVNRDHVLLVEAPLGLSLRAIPGVGAEVVRTDPESAAARAGIQPGDVITVFGESRRPSPLEIKRVFDAAQKDARVAVAVTRGERHQVLVLRKP